MATASGTAFAADHIVAVRGGRGGRYTISRSALQQVVPGVAEATKSCEEDAKLVTDWISKARIPSHIDDSNSNSHDPDAPAGAAAILSLDEWRDAIESDLHDEKARKFACIVLSIAFLREKCRQGQIITPVDLDNIWNLIHSALTSPSPPVCTVSRSAQGFLAVPLCSSLKDGNIAELWRLHVWLPDGRRGNTGLAIHSHQAFAESWILAGKGKDQRFRVEPVEGYESATHAEFAIGWDDGKNQDTTYKTHQISSTVVNTHKWACATETDSAVHKTNTNYTIPQATYHTTKVEPDGFHATVFFFDSSRGFKKDAGVLGPKDDPSFTHIRDPGGVTPADLAGMVDAVRSWEKAIKRGQDYAENSSWEFAMRAFDEALKQTEDRRDFPNAIRYKYLTIGELGKTNRRFGRYEKAVKLLEEAIEKLGACAEQVELQGETGVVLRQMDRLEEAEKAFQNQLAMAKQLKSEPEMCRALGNWGMVNYQLALRDRNRAQMDFAIEQLKERVRLAERLDRKLWASIGLSRLSLCYTAQEKKEEARDAALGALHVAQRLKDPTVLALSRFFYGRVLLQMYGQPKEALKQFNPHQEEKSTPAIALCKEPSSEHYHYLKELIAAGADLERTDEFGYTALDWAIFNHSRAMEEAVLRGLRQGVMRKAAIMLEEIEDQRVEAKRRKGYREIFQEKLRPMLNSGDPRAALHVLRETYERALAEDTEREEMFDALKFVRYSEFKAAGKIPRSNMKSTTRFVSEPDGEREVNTIDFLIFFSYRWMKAGASSPDDEKNTQYHRMLRAADEFLKEHPHVVEERLGIWVVSRTRGTHHSGPLNNIKWLVSDLTFSHRTMPVSTRKTQGPA